MKQKGYNIKNILFVLVAKLMTHYRVYDMPNSCKQLRHVLFYYLKLCHLESIQCISTHYEYTFKFVSGNILINTA